MKLKFLAICFLVLPACSTTSSRLTSDSATASRNPSSQPKLVSDDKAVLFFCKPNDNACTPSVQVLGSRLPVTGVDAKVINSLESAAADYAFNKMYQSVEFQIKGFVKDNKFYVVEGGLDQLAVPH